MKNLAQIRDRQKKLFKEIKHHENEITRCTNELQELISDERLILEQRAESAYKDGVSHVKPIF